MSVRLIVDSACDLMQDEADKLGLILVPLTICFGDKQYRAGIDFTNEDFYDLLAQSQDFPSTSQPTPYDFDMAYRRVKAAGEEAVVITMSSRLSGTYQSACMAAEEYPGSVYIVDSLSVTVGERILLYYAIRLRDAGMAAAELTAELEKVKQRIRVFGVVDTLEYLVKGGRLSKTAGMAGTLLGIRPVLTLQDGELIVLGKARGAKNSNNLLNKAVREQGIDFTMPYMVGYSGKDRSMLASYIEGSRDLWANDTDILPETVIGSTIGTHTGPGLIGAGFFCKAD